jgi:protocatechuate 3,4-dioxygenase beta subunit
MVVFYACTKPFSIDKTINDPGATVTASVSGKVTDITGKPVSNATIHAGLSVSTTDINGQFMVGNAQLSQNTGIVKVSKTGFFDGSRTITVKEGTINNVAIELIPKKASGTFATTEGGAVTVNNGGSAQFPANSVVTATGTTYSGTVTVSSFFLNPTDADFSRYMPGELRGVTTTNKENALLSYGMMAVELNGSAGEKLQLATGKPATLTFPITAALQASAPASITLWYYDETSGMWKEEGTATKSGTNYVGNVAHFSFWNCDQGMPLMKYEATFKDQNGNPLTNALVSFSRNRTDSSNNSSVDTRSGYTCSDGSISAALPANEELKMQVYFSNCTGSPVYTNTFNSGTQDIKANTITVNLPAASSVTFSGTVTDCNGKAVSNGYVQVSLDNNWYNTNINTDGSVNLVVPRCNTTSAVATINVYDLSGAQQNLNPITATVTSGAVSLGQLSACGLATNEYINLSVNGTAYSFVPPADSLELYGSGSNFNLQAYGKTTNKSFYGSFSATGIGTSSFTLLNINLPGVEPIGYNVPFTITEFGAVGQYISGTFSGSVRDSLSANQAIITNGTFRIKRNN